jgi:ribose transport system substrate-binding protein
MVRQDGTDMESGGGTMRGRAGTRAAFLTQAGGVAGAALLSTLYAPGKIFADGPMIFSPKKRYSIAIVPKGLNNPVFALANLGGQQRALELGNIHFLFEASPTTDTAGDVNIVQALVQQRVDAIGISCNDPRAYVNVINSAVDSGIKVMCWDSDAPTSKRAVFYGVNSIAVGRKMGLAMNRLTGGRGKIAVISGDPAALNLTLRLQGAKQTLSRDLQIVSTQYCHDDIPTAIAQTEGVIRAHPDLAGILMIGGYALLSDEGATPLLKAHKGKIKVVAFDVLAQTVAYLRDHLAQSVWTQDYWGWGYESVAILYGLLQGQRWHSYIPQPSHEVRPQDWRLWQQRWAATSKGLKAAAAVWREAPFRAPGP